MATDHHIKNFSAADIEKYHKGLLSAKEMHAMEKAALEDPFLADAMEGYMMEGVNATADMAELQERLAARTQQENKAIPLKGSNKTSFPWMRAAVMTGVLAGAGILAYLYMFDNKVNEIAKAEPVKREEIRNADPSTAAVAPVRSDSNKPAAGGFTFKKNPPASTINQLLADTTMVNNTGSGTTDLVVVAEAPGAPEKKDQLENEAINRGYKTTELARQKEVSADKTGAGKNYYTNASGNTNPASADPLKSKAVAPSRRADEQSNFRTNIFRGRVTDASNSGVPFANVTNTEDNVGTYTDARGYFNLTSPDSVLNVQVRSIGFENRQVQLRNNLPGNQVVLQDDRKGLNTLVVSNQKPNATARAQRNNVQLEEPEPADGWDNYDTYLANNLNIPGEYRNKPDANASVEVSFEVDKNGEPVNIRVEKSLCDKCDKEAIRLIKEGPKWKRNTKNGRTTVTIPFNQLF
ncbi:MAG: carboxypeptidase-like regulatory domain-containing protein [Sphingobacteriales bacterium]|nr:carboxypeptidase-like regulatory domain-containing protein [Sphingobacteriales bacterium]